jgi:hypothetical protein
MFAVVLALAALLVVIVGLLAVPVVIVIHAERAELMIARWQVSGLFGLLRAGATSRTPPAKPDSGIEHPGKRRSKTGRGGAALAALRTRGFPRRTARLVIDLFRRVSFDDFHVDATFGCENPADTGFVFGCLSPVLILARDRGLDIRCSPMFSGSGVRGVAAATIHLTPLSILSAVAAFLVSPEVLRATRAIWRART